MNPEQRAWSWYDWANSAYVTTVGAVLFAPYLTSVAEVDACGRAGTAGDPWQRNLDVLGVAVSPGSLVFYVITLTTIASALATAMVLVTGDNWQLGALLLFVANIALGASLVV